MKTTEFTTVSYGYYAKPPDFRMIMAVKEMGEVDQILYLLANCLVNKDGYKLFGSGDEVNDQFRPREIVQLFEDVTAIIEREYDFSDPLSKPVSYTESGNGFPYSVSGKPL